MKKVGRKETLKQNTGRKDSVDLLRILTRATMSCWSFTGPTNSGPNCLSPLSHCFMFTLSSAVLHPQFFLLDNTLPLPLHYANQSPNPIFQYNTTTSLLFFQDPEDECSKLFQTVGNQLPINTASYLRL